ncbi:MAG TPA: penicillin-binding transpeptidase domain-containing protein [Candidatus Polarisedimenticolaceae bacterium]|nr:penicillin-binding transpeptidase domain-containing protein [Candidatus Polarisedimenticolaceae bacterium]
MLAQGLLAAAAVIAPATEADPARLFAGRDGCFELYDLKTDQRVARFNPERCAQRTSPCSTFKVPLALMAFDAGILHDENSAIEWDGTKTSRDAWNRDQTAATWMRDSVVWFSQRLTPQLGLARIEAYLDGFDFGNRDMSGGLTRAWLESSLRISPGEQLRFWTRFWREQLPVSEHAFAMTKKITFVERSPAGWSLHGKTGSCGVGSEAEPALWIGWFVGHVARGDREYVFAVSYTDRVASADRRPAGWIARDIAKRILAGMGLY